MITKLRKLWQQTFGDGDAFLDSFFAAAYSPDRCRYLLVNGQLAAALYWFDCQWQDRRLAYLYAVATDEAFRGQGLCRKLMDETHQHLKRLGYDGTVLVPGSDSLFRLYEKLGYKTFGYVQESSAAAGSPIPLRPVKTAEYAALRREYLPRDGVVQEGALLAFLAANAQLYAGERFVLAATRQGDRLFVQELLGSCADGSGIVAALGCAQGQFRTPGTQKPFAMFHGLTDCPAPGYFGIAMD